MKFWTEARHAGRWRLPAACVMACTLPAAAQPLTVASSGGANGQAQAQAFVQPFAQRRGMSVVTADYNGDLAPIREIEQRFARGAAP